VEGKLKGELKERKRVSKVRKTPHIDGAEDREVRGTEIPRGGKKNEGKEIK